MDLKFFENQLISEYNTLNDNYNDVCEALEKEQKKSRKLKNHHKTSMNFMTDEYFSFKGKFKTNNRITQIVSGNI